ncbi:MAG: dihydropteroate synthase [Thermoleophilia bacterium]
MEALATRIPGPALMGIVNVTPDSFSDGGQFTDRDAAIQHALELVAQGAAIVDVGGESTRPGAAAVSEAEELQRVVDVVTGIRAASSTPISIDTMKSAVAEAAISAGATLVNDVTGCTFDPRIVDVVRDAEVDVCVMHMQGEPRTMQDAPHYDDVVREVGDYLRSRVEALMAAGIDPRRIAVDPGIGFGKTVEHNVALLAATHELGEATGCPVLVGVSRKRFLGALLGDAERDRTTATVAAGMAAIERGAWMLRVHDVAPHAEALAVLRPVLGSGTVPA